DGAFCLSGARQAGCVAVAARIVFTSNGVASGWADRIRAASPAMCGAARLLPVATIRPPSRQATSTSRPQAPNSTGGRGLENQGLGGGVAGARPATPARTEE